MKKATFGLLFCLLFMGTGCAKWYDRFAKITEVNYAPTDPQNIELFFTNTVQKPYEAIGYVNITLSIYSGALIAKNQVGAMNKMKEMAAKNGADAIVNIDIRSAPSYYLTGLAVKWKP